MSQQTYLKVPFVWEKPKSLVEIPFRLEFKAVKTLSYEVLLSTVALVMESSIDASDRKQVVEHGSDRAAEQFLSESKNGFLYQDEWWQIGFNSDDRVVGFVFPVIYPGYAKDGLEEATIYLLHWSFARTSWTGLCNRFAVKWNESTAKCRSLESVL